MGDLAAPKRPRRAPPDLGKGKKVKDDNPPEFVVGDALATEKVGVLLMTLATGVAGGGGRVDVDLVTRSMQAGQSP